MHVSEHLLFLPLMDTSFFWCNEKMICIIFFSDLTAITKSYLYFQLSLFSSLQLQKLHKAFKCQFSNVLCPSWNGLHGEETQKRCTGRCFVFILVVCRKHPEQFVLLSYKSSHENNHLKHFDSQNPPQKKTDWKMKLYLSVIRSLQHAGKFIFVLKVEWLFEGYS